MFDTELWDFKKRATVQRPRSCPATKQENHDVYLAPALKAPANIPVRVDALRKGLIDPRVDRREQTHCRRCQTIVSCDVVYS